MELVKQSIILQKEAQSTQPLENALSYLLSGPQQDNDVTTIPTGTKLLSLKLDKQGIHINLSQEFTTGGGSASMTGRIGQVLYTATSLEPNRPVWLAVEGEPLTELGGEGLEVVQPLTRQNFEENFLDWQ